MVKGHIDFLEQLKTNADKHDLDQADIKLLDQAINELKSNNNLDKTTQWTKILLSIASIVEKLNDIFGGVNNPP